MAMEQKSNGNMQGFLSPRLRTGTKSFPCILLETASHKVNPDLMGRKMTLSLQWEEVKGHVAKGMDTGVKYWGQVSTQESNIYCVF